MNQELFIVIPVHNRVNLTRNFLLSLRRQTRTNFTVVVIDDGSTDGTSEMIQSDFPEVVLLRGDGNLWWSRATNLGVRYALDQGAKYLMTVNDDTVLADDFIEKMLYWAERKPRVLLGAMAVDSVTRQPVYGGERINWLSAGYVKVLDLVAPEDRHGLHEATHLPGRGLLIPAEVFHKIGLFAEKRLPQSMADFDLTLRAVRAGYRAFCNYDAKVFVFPETIAGLHFRREKSWRNYFNHLFGIKGSSNLIFFFFYAVRNCPIHLLPFYLAVGFAKRVLGYLRDWSIETVKASMKKVAT